MKKIILTLDYELFFGERTGSVNKSMIEPMDLLINLMDKYDCKMTVFWDVLHYIKAKEFNKTDETLQLENSIGKLVKHGHDIQLHIHSHWLDVKLENNEWIFPTYEHYKLQSFSEQEIVDIITLSKQTIENITNTKVFAFRAGGWQIEPFSKLKFALQKNDIYLDSSISNGLVLNSDIVSIDFRGYPIQKQYKFSKTPKYIDNNGFFTEYQITKIQVPFYIIIKDYINRFFNQKSYIKLGDGIGVGEIGKSILQKRFNNIKRMICGSNDMLSLEFRSDIIFDYMLNNIENYSLMIGHPKNIGYAHINYLDELLNKNIFKFFSLKEVI